MTAPLLTIAIPTYNRAALLARCLDALLPQVSAVAAWWPIELLISNNASTDQTPAVAAAYQERFAWFRYVENATNLGADGNIAQAFQLAAGQYVWVFSDDDLLLPGYLEGILEVLETQQPAVLHLASAWYSGEQVPTYAPQQLQCTTYADALEFVRRVHHWTTFITGNIIAKLLVADLPTTYAFADTNLVQLGWVLPAIFKGRASAVVTTPVVAARGGNSGGYQAFKTFSTNFSYILDCLIQAGQIPGAVKHIISVNLLDSQFPQLLQATNFGKGGTYNQEPVFRTLLANYWHYPLFWRNVAWAYLKNPLRPAWQWARGLVSRGRA